MLCAIWQHLCNLKNLKNTHGGVLLLVKSQALAIIDGAIIAKIVNCFQFMKQYMFNKKKFKKKKEYLNDINFKSNYKNRFLVNEEQIRATYKFLHRKL